MIGVLEEGRSCVAIEEDSILYIQSKLYVLNSLDTNEETTCATPSTHTDLEPEEQLPSDTECREASPSILQED